MTESVTVNLAFGNPLKNRMSKNKSVRVHVPAC